jgi:hypothetical protein
MINRNIINNSSANTKSKMEGAFYPAFFGLDDELKVSVMTNRKEDYSGTNENMLNGGLSEAERFDRSFRNSESESGNDEFHWMAHASYNMSKPARKLLIKTTKNEK